MKAAGRARQHLSPPCFGAKAACISHAFTVLQQARMLPPPVVESGIHPPRVTAATGTEAGHELAALTEGGLWLRAALMGKRADKSSALPTSLI